ncbi:WXG100 family type VII secretion target [Lentzea sp. BCCO 10_0856]|uniref:ESAT-6-like protein n=1 Tax=Lentzea miocenica TaxID=3095431 RepID=A0ABU4T2M0_9PSEU|nr:WXG100 family type VII secretion target [Lentzea sp. BCCO 10_0856]MDX8032350.1 WXG100 family type VII secretion target [Lentzea sp. BCCO 10_0856]
MGDKVKVSFGELEAASGSITSAAGQIQSQLDDLKQQVQKVMAEYTGDAAAAYQEAQGKWDRSAADLQAVLSSIGIAVRDASEAYAAAEGANARRW